MSKSEITAVLRRYARLTYYGFQDPASEDFQDQRKTMLCAESVAQFDAVKDSLKHVAATKTPNLGSYQLKHAVERRLTSRREPMYIASGMCIAAVIAAGFRIRHTGGSPNALIGISSRSLRRIEKKVRAPAARAP